MVRGKRWVTTTVFAVIGVIFLAGIGVLIVTAVGLQKKITTNTPQYSAQELYNQGVAQANQGDYTQAEQYLEQSLLQVSDNSYRSQLAVVKYRLKKYSEAVAQYQKLVDAGQDVAFAWNGMGNAYRDWGTDHAAQAEAAYRSSFAADPGYVAAYSNLAMLLDSQSKRSEAKAVAQLGQVRTGNSQLVELVKRLQ